MRCFIGLGSNTGDRLAHVRHALDELRAMLDLEVRKVSRVFETEPVGKKDQPEFLNAAAEIVTDLTPLQLLQRLKAVEQRIGRTETERWGPREIDLDLLFAGDAVLTGPPLTVPHPEVSKRMFVLVPLAEIAPTATDPRTGLRFIDLRDACPGKERVVLTQGNITL